MPEAMGLVARSPDPSDGRAVLVRATRAGTARHGRTKQTARAVYEEFFSDWTEEDLRQAAHVAARLVAALEHRSGSSDRRAAGPGAGPRALR